MINRSSSSLSLFSVNTDPIFTQYERHLKIVLLAKLILPFFSCQHFVFLFFVSFLLSLLSWFYFQNILSPIAYKRLYYCSMYILFPRFFMYVCVHSKKRKVLTHSHFQNQFLSLPGSLQASAANSLLVKHNWIIGESSVWHVRGQI